MSNENTPQQSSIDHVHLKTAELEKSIQFYESPGAKLEARYRFQGGETAALLLGNTRINISDGRGDGEPVLAHIGIAVPDLDAAYAGVPTAGGKNLRGPKDWEPDEIPMPTDKLPLRGTFAFVEGPDGEFIELLSPRA